MPRKRTGEIRESIERLRELEEHHRGKPEVARIRMLRILHENPSCAIDEVAATVGYSKQTVKRWLKMYREGGIEALMQFDSRRRHEDFNEELSLLRFKLTAGEFTDLKSVADWIETFRNSG